jgi:hypothetical protein
MDEPIVEVTGTPDQRRLAIELIRDVCGKAGGR